MSKVRVGRLARARILLEEQQPALFPRLPDAVRAIFKNQDRHPARTRHWRICGVRGNDEHPVARLGYETRDETDLYDPVRRDFKREAVLRGQTAMFVVRMADLAVAFERRPPAMTERDFASGLRCILCSVIPYGKWEVVPVDTKATFAEWTQGVKRVNRFRFRLDPERHRNVDGFAGMIQPRPGVLTIDFRSSEGADVDDGAFRKLVALAEQGSGEVVAVGHAVGRESTGVMKAWESVKSSERVVEETPPIEDDSDDASEERLLKALATVPVDPSW